MPLADSFLIEMDARTSCVQLARWQGSLSVSGRTPPEGAAVWVGTYAIVLACPVEWSAAYDEVARAGVGWLTDALEEWSVGPGRLVDGYLVVVASEAPSDDSRRLWAGRFEMETSVCRRHVVWPETNRWDLRLDKVTVVRLPEVGATAAGDSEPLLPTRAAAVLEMLQGKTSISGVVQRIRTKAELAAERPNAD